jgi:formylglycine-generating enzyme required for sulfatase activity
MPRIFISYRRDDAGGYSLLLSDRLARAFGRGRVFMDIDTIQPGTDFVEVIDKAVGACDALIALIGKHWLTMTDERGRRRLDVPEDFVRLEIAAALEKDIRVIPVLVRGAPMPSSDDLPEPIKALARRHAVELSDERMDYDLKRLINVLGRVSSRSVTDSQSWLDAYERFVTRERLFSPDRGSDTAARLSAPRATRLLFEPEMIDIPAGPFLCGDDNRLTTLAEYAIGKYPVRVIEYRAFIDDDGYGDGRFWTETGWQWKDRQGRTQPDLWGDPIWTGHEWLPAVGVCWHEAVAYCRWLAAKTHWPYRLPTTLEWEKAARGPDGRVFPWGDDAQNGMGNFYGAGIGHTSRVDAFSPAGDSPFGVADMVGNVSEWCQTKWNRRPDAPLDDDPGGNAPRMRHGGSWSSVKLVRPSTRLRGDPDFASNYVGFRVARSELE